MPSLDNWIELPRQVLQQLYEKHNGNVAWAEEAEKYFTSRLSSSWNSIVSLNESQIKDLKDGQLVRFRVMIQDQLGPEMYATGAVLKNSSSGTQRLVTGKFNDEIILGTDEEVVSWNSTESRNCYYCVPIPGETDWVKQACKGNAAQSSQASTQESCSSVSKKRSLEMDEGNDESMEDSLKKACSSDGVAVPRPAPTVNVEKILNFPLPSSDPMGCILKIYSEEDLILNDVIEVVGIVSFDTPTGDAMDTDEPSEFQPPSSLIPRIHCLLKNKWLHNNPNLASTGQRWDEETAVIAAEASSTRQELLGLFTEFFVGDTAAATYFLCHLISRVYARKDALALGKLSLNLTNITTEGFNQSLYNLLQTLVTKAHYLPMSLQNMNTLPLIPKKDYVENRLVSGRLQLSAHTHLVLDETAMTEGQLFSDGVRNVTALGNVSTWQKVEYDFNFHPVEILTDISVLILSERKSMISCDAHLPLRFDAAQTFNPSELIQRLQSNAELLHKMRNYLTAVRLAEFNLGDSMLETVQKDFIDSRAPGREKPMSTEDFHLLLVLSRLLALTYGKKELTDSIWQEAKSMETERKSRLSSPIR